MENTVSLIHDCSECDFLYENEYDFIHCRLDSNSEDLADQIEDCLYESGELPKLCPLRNHSITYKLATEA